jgi:hypothetical protein
MRDQLRELRVKTNGWLRRPAQTARSVPTAKASATIPDPEKNPFLGGRFVPGRFGQPLNETPITAGKIPPRAARGQFNQL